MFKLKVPELKTKLSEKFKVYNKEESRAEMAISRLNIFPKGTLQKSLLVKYIHAVSLKETFKDKKAD